MSSASQNFNYGNPTPGPQNPTAQKVMDHVFFLSNDQWKSAREEQQFDYIIVGSGFCGYAFAERILSQDKTARILMLERGTFFLPEHFQNLSPAYFKVLGGLSETFPWTITRETLKEYNVFQHGMIPFIGGRSIMWSAWCPTPSDTELAVFPKTTIDALVNKGYFDSAKKLLNVVDANHITEKHRCVGAGGKTIYGTLQHYLADALKKVWLKTDPAVSRCFPAPLAVGSPTDSTYNFFKFSVPAELLDLITQCQGTGQALKVAADCTVERIIHSADKQGRAVATALETSRGVVSIRNAKVILATGALPPTTLIQNSFPKEVPQAGAKFAAHVISSIICRIKVSSLKGLDTKALSDLEIGANYMDRQFSNGLHYHIQMSAFYVQDVNKNLDRTLRYTPDVIASASKQQLLDSEAGKYMILVCACLGEIDHGDSPDTQSSFKPNPSDRNITTNSVLDVILNSKTKAMWDVMDNATFEVVNGLVDGKKDLVEWWIPSTPFVQGTTPASTGTWRKAVPPEAVYRRAPDLVHESGTLHMGTDAGACVGDDYKLNGTTNVYVTGASLWPKSGSWNPTMTMCGMAQHLADGLTAQRAPATTAAGTDDDERPAKKQKSDKPSPSDDIYLHSAINIPSIIPSAIADMSKAFKNRIIR